MQPGSFRNPPHSISPGTGRKFPCANPPRLTQSSASVCQMTNVLGSRLTSRCAESLSEIKPLYSEVNDACFAAQAPSPLSPVPSTECRCHRWCNSIPLKAFCPLFFFFQSQEYFLSIAKKTPDLWVGIGSVVSSHCCNSPLSTSTDFSYCCFSWCGSANISSADL